MQQLEGLITPNRELELDKQNDQAFDSSIDFTHFILQTYFSHMISTHDFPPSNYFPSDLI